MRTETLVFDPRYPDCTLTSYIHDPHEELNISTRRAIIVCPGGGYQFLSEREGEPVALRYFAAGLNVFVLRYSIREKAAGDAPLIESALAVKYIRDHAEEYFVDPAYVFITGFSAGGHLTACAGVFWNRPEATEGLDVPYGYNKPRGIMPIYPVISMKGHGFSIKNLLCKDDPTREETDYVSVDQHVTADSSPVFIVHSADDELVDARNSLDFAMAYANAGVPYELHIFPHAQHGCALGNAITDMGNPNWNDPMIARWVEMAAYWAEHTCK